MILLEVGGGYVWAGAVRSRQGIPRRTAPSRGPGQTQLPLQRRKDAEALGAAHNGSRLSPRQTPCRLPEAPAANNGTHAPKDAQAPGVAEQR